jgi:hypothetical protein
MLEKNATISDWIPCGLLEFSHRIIFQPSTLALFGEKDFRLFDDNFHHFSAAFPH